MLTPELVSAHDTIKNQIASLEGKMLEGNINPGVDTPTVADFWANYRAAVMQRKSLYTLLHVIEGVMDKGAEKTDDLEEMPETPPKPTGRKARP